MIGIITNRGDLGGYTIRADYNHDRPVMEAQTFTCQHCNAVTFCCDPVTFKPAAPEDLGGRCTVCNNLICKNCVGKGCYHIEKRLDDEEKADRDLFVKMVDAMEGKWQPMRAPDGFQTNRFY